MATTTQEKIAVMQAHVDGKTIQVRSNGSWSWSESYNPRWNWCDFDYRVAPEILKIYVYRTKDGEILSRLKPFESKAYLKEWALIKTIETEI